MRLRRTLKRILTEQSSPARLGWAVGVGVFIAVTPLYGLHLIMAVTAATAFGLNRTLTVLASNFPLPIFQPALALGGLQLGAATLTGEFLPISLETLYELDLWQVGAQWTVGTLMLGSLLGTPLGVATVVTARYYRRRRVQPVGVDENASA